MKLSKLSIVIGFVIISILIFFHTRGSIIHDEGYILNSSFKIIQGQVPYKDFSFVYTPLSIYLTSLSFLFFSPSILASRILMILISILSIILIYRLIKLTTKNSLYAYLSVFIFLAWGPSHLNFSWPVMFAIPAGLLTIYFLLKHLESGQNTFLFLSGLFGFIVFIAKQNFGISILIPLFLYFLLNKKSFRNLNFIYLIIGYCWGLILFITYLIISDSFGPFINNFYDYTIRRILINSSLSTDFVYKDTILLMVLRTSFYLLPAILSIWAILLLIIRKRYQLIFFPAFVLVFYIFGIRPTTDYVHLVPLLSLIGLPTSLIIRYSFSNTLRSIFLLFTFFMIFLGFYTSLYKGYYRWDSPLILHDKFTQNEKINIFLNEKNSTVYLNLIKEIQKNTSQNNYIFVTSYDPLIYFITNRKDPMPDNILKTEISSEEYHNEVLGNLVGKKIPIIVMRSDQELPLNIKKYIFENYIVIENVGEFIIFKRGKHDDIIIK